MTITNTGDAPLAVQSLAVEGAHAGDFLVDGSDRCTVGTLAAGAACTMSVRFAPGASGDRAATLAIVSNAGGSPTHVALTGTGGELPQGPAGEPGSTGSPGATGPQGPAGPQGATSPLVLVAFRATVSARRVVVRYAITGTAVLALAVRRSGGRRTTVVRAVGRRGIRKISWNRRIGGRRAPRGRYRLYLTATRDGRSVTSAIAVRLR